ncbi:MAG: hypothetical protein PVH61_36585 [Candidatus Aminicenantes bacterium]|jgi:hypothetical protein
MKKDDIKQKARSFVIEYLEGSEVKEEPEENEIHDFQLFKMVLN